MKKIVSVLLVLALLFSLSVTAFADDPKSPENEAEITPIWAQRAEDWSGIIADYMCIYLKSRDEYGSIKSHTADYINNNYSSLMEDIQNADSNEAALKAVFTVFLANYANAYFNAQSAEGALQASGFLSSCGNAAASALYTAFLKENEASSLAENVMKTYNKNADEIIAILKGKVTDGMLNALITKESIGTALSAYVTKNTYRIEAMIQSVVMSNAPLNDKIAIIKTYIENTLTEMVADMMAPYAAFGITMNDTIKGYIADFAEEYSGEVAKQFNNWMGAMLSDGSMLFILFALIEFVIIIACAFSIKKKNDRINEKSAAPTE